MFLSNVRGMFLDQFLGFICGLGIIIRAKLAKKPAIFCSNYSPFGAQRSLPWLTGSQNWSNILRNVYFIHLDF